MIKEELIARSPVRILEKGIEGGLKAGNIGIIASKKGIGKTSVLVQLALDKLLKNEKVIHVSFTTHTSYVHAWYDNIFAEVAKKKNLEHYKDVHDEAIKNRVILNFNQTSLKVEQITSSIEGLLHANIKATAVIIDGYDFTRANPADLKKMLDFAKKNELEIWYSCTIEGEEPLLDKNNFPIMLRDFADDISVLIMLEPKADHIHFVVVKDHSRINPADLKIKLDSKSLLIAEE
jgi:KaiC/GvpD/RAD55 family RecA-like ATPase